MITMITIKITIVTMTMILIVIGLKLPFDLAHDFEYNSDIINGKRK